MRPITGALSRVLIAASSAIGALRDPTRADLVAALGETTAAFTLEQMHTRMRNSPVGRDILKDRPRINQNTLATAQKCPPHSFGSHYASFMAQRGFDPDERSPVKYIHGKEELAYVMQRSREVHDFWHVLFGCPTTLLGELQLKALEFTQTGLPMCALSVLGAQVRLNEEDRRLLWQYYIPWATRAGLKSHDLMNIYYEQHLHEDMSTFRARFGIIPAPKKSEVMLLL